MSTDTVYGATMIDISTDRELMTRAESFLNRVISDARAAQQTFDTETHLHPNKY